MFLRMLVALLRALKLPVLLLRHPIHWFLIHHVPSGSVKTVRNFTQRCLGASSPRSGLWPVWRCEWLGFRDHPVLMTPSCLPFSLRRLSTEWWALRINDHLFCFLSCFSVFWNIFWQTSIPTMPLDFILHFLIFSYINCLFPFFNHTASLLPASDRTSTPISRKN